MIVLLFQNLIRSFCPYLTRKFLLKTKIYQVTIIKIKEIDRFKLVAFTIFEPFLIVSLILFRYITLVYEQYIISTDYLNQKVDVIFLAIILIHTMIIMNFSISKYKKGNSPYSLNLEVLLIILTVACDYSIILIENLPGSLNMFCFFISMI